ncbi:MAG: hypothetical protein LBT98_02640 [Puniceicoccales bacterium]|nr:hypothetical protein [Puniceicoccales bacterium]
MANPFLMANSKGPPGGARPCRDRSGHFGAGAQNVTGPFLLACVAVAVLVVLLVGVFPLWLFFFTSAMGAFTLGAMIGGGAMGALVGLVAVMVDRGKFRKFFPPRNRSAAPRTSL